MTTPHPAEAHGEQTRRIAGYEILSKLGQGGMGAVYKAKQLSLDRTVALKVLPKQLTASQDFIQRFSREAKVTGQLNHPNIIKVYDVGRSNTGICYYSMEYVEGESLRSVLDREKRLGSDTVLRILEEMASALSHAHKHGIIHRDIKPDNILIDKDGASKLADLGLAKVAEDAGATALAKGGGYASIAGQVVGTPFYMSPEQAEGITVDTRSDLYSLGATAFHLLAGAPPFTAETPMGVITKHLTEPVPSIRARVPGTPSAVDALLKRLMAKLPSERFQTPAELVAEVSRIRREPAATPLPAAPRRPEAAASRMPLMAGGGVLLLVLAAVAMATRGKEKPPPTAVPVALPPPSVPVPAPPDRAQLAQEALHAAYKLPDRADRLRSLLEVVKGYPGTQPAQEAQNAARDIQHSDWRISFERARRKAAEGKHEEALQALAAMTGLDEEFRAERDRLQDVLRTQVPTHPSPPVPAPSPTADPFPALRARLARARQERDLPGLNALLQDALVTPGPGQEVFLKECQAAIPHVRLEEAIGLAQAHAWKPLKDLLASLEIPAMDARDHTVFEALKARAEINDRLAERWTFDAGDEGWERGAALYLEKMRNPTGVKSSAEKALAFGPSGAGGWSGELRSPLFTIREGARLSLTWEVFPRGEGVRIRQNKQRNFAYACLRDEGGQVLVLARPRTGPLPGLLRFRPLEKDWRDGPKPFTLNFRSEVLDLPKGPERKVRLCFGFCTDEPKGGSASMKLDDIEIFYGEDAP